MNSNFLTILLLFLVSISYPSQRVSGSYTLPAASYVQGYVDNLISSYNAFVPSSEGNFDSIKGYFTLYHAIGDTFRVIVMRSDNTSSFLVLNFEAIGGNDPTVILDTNDTFLGSYKLVDLAGEYVRIVDITFLYANTAIPIRLAMSVNSSDFAGDYMTNSLHAAQLLYNSDARSIPLNPNPISNQPQQNIGDLVLKLIVTVFGSVGTFVLVVLIAFNSKRRKRAVNDLRDLLHIKKKSPAQKKNKRNSSKNPKS